MLLSISHTYSEPPLLPRLATLQPCRSPVELQGASTAIPQHLYHKREARELGKEKGLRKEDLRQRGGRRKKQASEYTEELSFLLSCSTVR